MVANLPLDILFALVAGSAALAAIVVISSRARAVLRETFAHPFRVSRIDVPASSPKEAPHEVVGS